MKSKYLGEQFFSSYLFSETFIASLIQDNLNRHFLPYLYKETSEEVHFLTKLELFCTE